MKTKESILAPGIYKNVQGFGDAVTPEFAEEAMDEYAAQALENQDPWISVKDRLPETTEPLMGWNDNNTEREVIISNYKATVLAYNELIGVFKAEYKHGKWSEISRNSISTVHETIPTHWKTLPTPPKTTE